MSIMDITKKFEIKKTESIEKTTEVEIIKIKKFLEISISDTVIKFIFIILACLTLPHMIFNILPYSKE